MSKEDPKSSGAQNPSGESDKAKNARLAYLPIVAMPSIQPIACPPEPEQSGPPEPRS
jgi:hypothetical protein